MFREITPQEESIVNNNLVLEFICWRKGTGRRVCLVINDIVYGIQNATREDIDLALNKATTQFGIELVKILAKKEKK